MIKTLLPQTTAHEPELHYGYRVEIDAIAVRGGSKPSAIRSA
ncbi:hypothetical protein [Polaromonas sp.]